MKVGDLIRFPETEYSGLILEMSACAGACILITQRVNFKNPTWLSVEQLKRCAEVISESR